MLGKIKAEEIVYQLAKISQEELADGKIVLKVNNGNGQLANQLEVEWKEFRTEFYAHPKKTDHYLRKVQIESLEGYKVFFIRLNANGQACSSTRMIPKGKFLETYLCADQVGLA